MLLPQQFTSRNLVQAGEEKQNRKNKSTHRKCDRQNIRSQNIYNTENTEVPKHLVNYSTVTLWSIIPLLNLRSRKHEDNLSTQMCRLYKILKGYKIVNRL